MGYRFGIDLGGTSAKLALVSSTNKIIDEASVSVKLYNSAEKLVEALAQQMKLMVKSKPISNVGFGVAGDIDFKNGVVRISPNLGWKNVPLKALFQKVSRKKTIVDNDANAAAWGIYLTQAPRSCRNMIVATLGTGVGGGLIVDGELYRGETGSAGEIGHMTMVPNGEICNCGNRGCLESYVGGFYLARRARALLKRGAKSSLQNYFKKDPLLVTPRLLDEAARRGDRFSQRLWDDAGEMLGRGLGNLIYIFNPDHVFLCGGVSQSQNLILNPVRRALKERAFSTPIQAARLRVADDPATIGVIGAALLT